MAKRLNDNRHEVWHSYRSSNEPPVDACIGDVLGCEVYVLLAGQRYGYRPEKQPYPLQERTLLSITEIEFRTAVQHGKSVVVLFQDSVKWSFTDQAQNKALDVESLRLFHEDVNRKVTPARFDSQAKLISVLSTGVTEAVRKLDSQRIKDAPSIAPCAYRPHPRLLAHSLLLVHADGKDEPLARQLADALGAQGIGWSVQRLPWRPEDGAALLDLDEALAGARVVAWLATPHSLPRLAAAAGAWQAQVSLAQRLGGIGVGIQAGFSPAQCRGQPAVGFAGLRDHHRADGPAPAQRGDGAQGQLSPAVRQPGHALFGVA